MKFQDVISNMNTYIHTYVRTSRNQYAPHFFKVGGIKIGGGGGRGGRGWVAGVCLGGGGVGGVRVDVNEELKVLGKFTKKIRGGGGGGVQEGGVRLVGQGGCERRIEVFFWGGQGGCERNVNVGGRG